MAAATAESVNSEPSVTDDLEQPVPDVVAEGVVDLLETVQVEQQQRESLRVVVVERGGGALREPLAVREPGQRVRHRLLLALERDGADLVDDEQGREQQRQEVRPLLHGEHDQGDSASRAALLPPSYARSSRSTSHQGRPALSATATTTRSWLTTK